MILEKLNTIVSIVRTYSKNSIPQVWYTGIRNFGDELAPVISEAASGVKISRSFNRKRKHIVGLGSIFSSSNSCSIICGSGRLSFEQKLRAKPLDVVFVRGPHTGSYVKQYLSGKTIPYADPALFLSIPTAFPYLHLPNTKNIDTLVILHFTHWSKFRNIFQKQQCVVISSDMGLNQILDLMRMSKTILSSALHPLIVSDALDIPNIRIQLNSLPGGNHKFEDYYMTTDSRDYLGITIDGMDSIKQAIKQVRVNRYLFDIVEVFQMYKENLNRHFLT